MSGPGQDVDADPRGAQGVQVGDHNVQVNVFAVARSVSTVPEYLARVREIAPLEMLGRESELAEMKRFCGGSEPYCWWQGEPWAGKTALTAWVTLHPPDGVDVVSFFVNGRLSDQSDSRAFTADLIGQLAALAGEPAPLGEADLTGARLDRLRPALLERAAADARGRDRTLLLVVDGLDEDQGVRPRSGTASIASLLPRHPPAGLRVLVTSRQQRIPDDVPTDHPLRRCVPWTLAPSPHAQDIGRLARQELLEQLHQGTDHADVIGFLAAVRDELTASELAELAGQPRYRVEPLLAGAFGHSLASRTLHDTGEEAYAFAHATLLEDARQLLDRELEAYRDRVHGWAARYQSARWPDTTPRYFLGPYGRFLAREGEARRLTALVVDTAWTNRMLRAWGSDAAALAEIGAARELHLAADAPDLSGLGRLAVVGEWLQRTAGVTPRALPAAFARLGELDRARALALQARDPDAALADIVGVLTDERHLDQAADVAKHITSAPHRESARARVAAALAEQGQWTAAETLVASLGPGRRRDTAHAALSAARARAGQWAAANRAAMLIGDPGARGAALLDLAKAAYGVDPDRSRVLLDEAEQAAHAALPALNWPADEAVAADPVRLAAALGATKTKNSGPGQPQSESVSYSKRIRASTKSDACAALIVRWLAGTGQWKRAREAALRVPLGWHRSAVLVELSVTLADADQWDMAADVATGLLAGGPRVTALIALAGKAAAVSESAGRRFVTLAERFIHVGAGFGERIDDTYALALAMAPSDPACAVRLAATAAALAADLHQDKRKLAALSELASVARRGGPEKTRFADAAIELKESMKDPGTRVEAMLQIGVVLARADEGRALRLVEAASEVAVGLRDAEARRSIEPLIKALGWLGAYERAERLVPLTEPGHDRWEILASLSRARALAGHWQDAERYAAAIRWESTKDTTLLDLCGIAARAGRWDDALRLTEDIKAADRRDEAYDRLADAAGAARRWDAAADYVAAIGDRNVSGPAIVALCGASARAGHWKVARRLADSATGAHRDEALTAVAQAAAASGRWHDADELAAGIADPQQRVAALSETALAAAEADPQRSRAYLEAADDLICSGEGDAWRAEALIQLAEVALRLDPQFAAELAGKAAILTGRMPDPAAKARTLAAVAAVTAHWSPDQAAQLARSAEALIRDRCHAAGTLLAELVAPFAAAGHAADAERVALDALSDGYTHLGGETALAGLTPARACAVALRAQDTLEWHRHFDVAASIYARLYNGYQPPLELARSLAVGGHWADAERVAQAIPAITCRLSLYTALASIPDPQAARFIGEAHDIICQIPEREQYGRQRALVALCEALAKAQRWSEATRAAKRIRDDDLRAEALEHVAAGLLDAGDWRRAERVIGRIGTRHTGQTVAQAERRAIDRMVAAGRLDAAERLADRLGDVARSELAGELIRTQQWEHAERTMTLAGSDSTWQPRLPELARALIAAGQWDEASRIVSAQGDRDRESWGDLTSELASALAAAGEPRARAAAEEAARGARRADGEHTAALVAEFSAAFAVALADSATDTAMELLSAADRAGSPAMSAVARARAAITASLVLSGRWDEAGHLIENQPEWAVQGQLSSIVWGLAGSHLGDEPASRLAWLAERAVAGMAPDAAVRSLTHLGAVAANAGLARFVGGPLADAVEQLVPVMSSDRQQCAAYSELAALLADTNPDRAVRAARRAEITAASIPSDHDRARALERAVFTLAKLGHPQAAERIAATFSGYPRVCALAAAAAGVMDAEPDRAHSYIATAERLADDAADWRGSALTTLAEVIAAHDPAWSIRLADKAQREMTDGMDWGMTAAIAVALSAAGTDPRQLTNQIPSDFGLEIYFAGAARKFIETGKWEQAERVCRDIGGGSDQEIVWEDLTSALLTAGRWADAERLAGTNPRPTEATCLMEAVARLRRSAGEPGADAYARDAGRAAALLLARLGSPQRPRGLLQRVDRWARAFTLVAIVDPAAAEAAAQQLRELATAT